MYDMIINQMYKLKEFGVNVKSRIDMPTPKPIYEEIEIPGRNGKLIKFLGYEDNEIEVDLNLYDVGNISKRMRVLSSLLLKTETISFTDDLEVFYKVKKVEIDNVERKLKRFGYITVKFTLDPFSYLSQIFPITITSSTKLANLGTYESEPYIKVNGNGNITLDINGNKIELKNVEGFIEIDSEAKETYKNNELQNDKKVGEYPTFLVGENTISWTGNVTSIEVDPRWRCL